MPSRWRWSRKPCDQLLARVTGFGRSFLSASPTSVPEPDLAVVVGTPREFEEHPDRALLVVEISDASLAYDRGEKLRLYAAAGINEYWILNLVDRNLEVYRSPVRRDPGSPDEEPRYGKALSLASGDQISPESASDAVIAISEFAPQGLDVRFRPRR